MGEVDLDEQTRTPGPLVQQGTAVAFRPSGGADVVLGTVLSVERHSLRIVPQDGAHALPSTHRTGALVIVNNRGQKVEVSAVANPSGSLLEIEPRSEPVDEHPAHRIPVFAPADVVVLRRDGGALSGNLLDLSIVGCTIRLWPNDSITLHCDDRVAVSSTVAGEAVGYRGEIADVRTVRDQVSVRVRFTEVDDDTLAVTEAFIAQRLEQLASAGQARDAIHGVISIGEETQTVQIEPGSGALNVDLSAGLSVRAQLRVAGVGPVLAGRGITEHRGERTHIRWIEVDPVTRALLDR